MTKNNHTKFFSAKEKLLLSGAVLLTLASIFMILVGTETTSFHRMFSNLTQGATMEESLRSVTTPETNKDMAERVLANVGADNVEIIITDDKRNCALWETGLFGQKSRKVANEETGQLSQGGCWRSVTPDSIYLSTGLISYDGLKFVVLHEYAHVLQERGEWPRSVEDYPQNEMSHECLADVWAHKHGVPSEKLFYFSQGLCEDYRDMLSARGKTAYKK